MLNISIPFEVLISPDGLPGIDQSLSERGIWGNRPKVSNGVISIYLYELCGDCKHQQKMGFHRMPLQLRTYPPRFALRIAKFYSRFISKCEALQPIDSAAPNTAQDILSSFTWEGDQWNDAGLVDLFCYLRGSTGLTLGKWRPCFPTHI